MITKDLTFYLSDFKKKLIFLNRTQGTIVGYVDAIFLVLSHFNKPPKTITVSETIDYLNTIKVHSRKTAIAAIKFFYTNCLNSDKMNKLKYPKIPEHMPDVLSEDEMVRLIKSASNVKHRTMIMMLYSTGMRVSELLNLRWKNLDRARMEVKIVQGKGMKDRPVKLTEKMVKQLIIYCHEYKLHCFDSDNYVFPGMNKKRYSRRSVETFIEKYALKAGIKKRVSPLVIRHCTGTHLRSRGVDLATIQDMFGHKRPSTTRIYAKLDNLKSIPDLL